MYFETGDRERRRPPLCGAWNLALSARRASSSARWRMPPRWIISICAGQRCSQEPAHPRARAARRRSPLGNVCAFPRGLCVDAHRSTDEGILESDASLALAERLKDHGLLADALYVKSALAQLRGEWREARAHSDRVVALSAHQLPFLLSRMFLEYETGNREAGDGYLQRAVGSRTTCRSTLSVGGRICGAGVIATHLFVERQHESRCRIASGARGVGETTSNPAGAGTVPGQSRAGGGSQGAA